MASRRAGPETLGGGASTPRFLARLSAHAASLVCIASHASSTYGSSCSASAPPSAAIACVFASSTDISSSPSARSSDVSVYLAKASHAPPSAAKSERGQAAARSSFVTAARSSAPARCASARCRAAFAAATARVVAAATGTALSRRRDTRDMRTGDGFRKLSAFEGDIFAVSFAFASSSSARATTGLIGRRRTPLRSASRRGWKHMGHFAGSPSARLVTACLATHGKQNAWPHSVTCGAVIRSSRHTGQRSGSAAPNSTSTTSSQSTMWSGSRLLPARSAQSATRNRKLACRKSSLECAPRRAREDGAPRPPPRPPPFRPPPFRPLMNGPPRRGASVSRAGARKFNRKSARTPLPPRLGGAASVDPGRGEDASPSRDARSRAEVDGPLPALGPGGLAPPRPEPTLRLPLLRPPLPPPPPRAPLPPPGPRLGSRLAGTPLPAFGVGADAARAGGGANGAASRFSPPTPRAVSSAMATPRESTRARPPTRLTLMSRGSHEGITTRKAKSRRSVSALRSTAITCE